MENGKKDVRDGQHGSDCKRQNCRVCEKNTEAAAKYDSPRI